MNQKIVVVGLSAASMAFLTKLRSFDKVSEVVCFSAESQMPYNRCLLADVLTGDSSSEQIQLKPKSFFDENNITVHLDSYVDKIDTQKKEIFVGKESYPYDTLFLGIGTRPFVPSSLQTKSVEGVFTFHTLGDMQRIEQYIASRSVKSAIVIGAGLNGIEAVSSLAQKNIEVTVVEAQGSVLPGQVDQKVAAWTQDLMAKREITTLAGQRVASLISGENRFKGVVLDSGATIFSDMVIIAAGSRLNSELLLGTGIETHEGSVVVSGNMQTSVPSVLAAGDICAVPDFITKDLVRSTTWSDAMLQGLCAATTLSAAPRSYQGSIGLRDSHFFGKDFYACGDTTSGKYQKIERMVSNEAIDVIYAHEGKLKGFVLIGDVSKVPELKKLYVTQEVAFSS